jgi:Protein of unknown function (DUF1822)
MKSNNSLTIQSIYPDHAYIPLVGHQTPEMFDSKMRKAHSSSYSKELKPTKEVEDDRSALISTTSTNCLCQIAVTKYLEKMLGLDVHTAYPNNIKSTKINSLVDGFVLSIAGIRVVFIPSEDLDISSFELPQEWVDLSNWVADYYVPIQIDEDDQHLHLWGFIAHHQVKEAGEFDRIFRTYTINSQYLNDDLDNLWLRCELQASGEIATSQIKSLPTPQLSSEVSQDIINLFAQHQSIFSPRLEFSFEQWGGILNQPEWLEKYLKLTDIAVPIENKVFTKLSGWLDRNTTAIYQDWQSIAEFFTDLQLQAGMRSPNKSQKIQEFTIAPHNDLMYRGKDRSIEDLTTIIKNTTSQQERWDAIECLWQLDPNHPSLPVYKLLDLGLFFQGEQLSLLVSVISTSTNRSGILIRLSPSQENAQLPIGIQLSRLDETGNISRQVIAQDSKYQCIQLIFDADLNDLFSICVTLQGNQLIKHFQV